MVSLYFWYSDESEKWYKCKSENDCFYKAEQGFDVRKIKYKSMPLQFCNKQKSNKQNKRNKRNKRSKKW